MKKSLFLLIALFLIGTAAQAQLKYGVKAGLNLSKVSFSGDGADNIAVENFTGFQVGPTIELMIPIINFGVDASLLYSQQGFKIKGDKSYTTGTLEVPVNLKYKISLLDLAGGYIAIGPYIGFKLSDDLNKQMEAKSFAAGLNFGLGAEVLSHLQVGVNYKLGLTDDYNSLDTAGVINALSAKTSLWTISAAYFF